jgi:hypothetical protein
MGTICLNLTTSFEEFARFPSCLVRAAQYLREHSHSGDVIQCDYASWRVSGNASAVGGFTCRYRDQSRGKAVNRTRADRLYKARPLMV